MKEILGIIWLVKKYKVLSSLKGGLVIFSWYNHIFIMLSMYKVIHIDTKRREN